MIDYIGKLALAPMVRVSELPVRLLALRYGADLVWGPEIIDKKLVTCRREWNEKLKCVDFVETGEKGSKKEPTQKVVFRTFPAAEKGKLVFQMGTASPELAVEAAKVVARDVDAIDVNSGCPKHFSIHSGMGAALLRTPEKLESILRALVEQVGGPFGIDISVKIRILETEKETYDLVERLVKTGISCLTVHCRTTTMRNREDPKRQYLKGVAAICKQNGVACFVNGGVKGRSELESLMEEYGVSGAMVASSAELNLSCFSLDARPWRKVCQEYIDLCEQYDNHPSNTKYCLLKCIPGKSPLYQIVCRAKATSEMADALEEGAEMPGKAAEETGPKRKYETTDTPNKKFILAQ